MRLAAFAIVAVMVPTALSQTFVTKAFADQDFYPKGWLKVEKYGLNESQVIKIGHDRFVAWYCDATRAGKPGIVTAEDVYALAFVQSTAPHLLAMSRNEQKFIEESQSLFSELAFMSLNACLRSAHPDSVFSFSSAQSRTAVSEAVYALVVPEVSVPEPQKIDLAPLYDKVSRRDPPSIPGEPGYAIRLSYLVDQIEKKFADRSPREKRIALSFCQRMIYLALSSPPMPTIFD